jgi:hypothetical protein
MTPQEHSLSFLMYYTCFLFPSKFSALLFLCLLVLFRSLIVTAFYRNGVSSFPCMNWVLHKYKKKSDSAAVKDLKIKKVRLLLVK